MRDDADSAGLEFAHVFNIAVTYKVTVNSNKSSPLILPEYFTIQGK